MRNLVTHIAEVHRARTIHFPETPPAQLSGYPSQRPDVARERTREWRQARNWTERKSEGSGVVAPLTYRQQITRERLAESPLRVEDAPKYRKRKKS